LKRAARGSLKNAGRKKIAKNSPSAHHRTNLSGCIFAAKAHIDNHNMANVGPLTAEIGSPVWSTPAHFNGFLVLAALLHGTVVVGVSRTLRR